MTGILQHSSRQMLLCKRISRSHQVHVREAIPGFRHHAYHLIGKTRTYSLLLLAACLTGAGNPYAQLPEYHVNMLTEQQGLQATDFVSMDKDQEGFLWLLTQSAVYRFDGLQSWTFSFDGTGEDIYIDRHNRKWLLTRNVVYRFVHDYSGFQPVISESEAKDNFICLYEAGNDLFLLGANHLFRYTATGELFTNEVAGAALKPPGRKEIFSRNAQYLFFASRDSLYSYAFMTGQLLAVGKSNASNLLALSGNLLLVSDWDSRSFIVDFASRTIREIPASKLDPSGRNKFVRLYDAALLEADHYLLCSSIGLLDYHPKTGLFRSPVFYYRGEPLTNTRSIRSIFRDPDGVVYMSHADGVAFYSPERSTMQYIRDYRYRDVPLPDIDIRSFAQDPDGLVWIATINGIARLNLETGEMESYLAGDQANSINYPSIRHLLYHRDRLWVGTGGKGIWLFDPAKGAFSRPVFADDSTGRQTEMKLNDDFIWRMVPLANGAVFVAGGDASYIIHPPDFTVRRIRFSHTQGVARTTTQDSRGRIWYGTTKGVTCLDSTFQYLFSIVDSFPDTRVASLCEWKEGHMLIGTKGIYEVESDRDRILSFHRVTAIPTSRFVYCMEKDRQGNIWIGTDQGLYRYDPLAKHALYFDTGDNVQPQSFNSNGLYQSPSGWMFAGGKSGFNYFHPEQLEKKKIDLHPLVTGFSISGDDSTYYLQSTPYRIPYTKRNLQFNISAPDFENPYQLQYRYRLREGGDWIQNGNSRYVNLSYTDPGRYSFLPSVSYDGVDWFDGTSPVMFTIALPWWRQQWFLTLCAMGMIATGSLYRKYRKKKKKARAYQQAIDYFAGSAYESNSVEEILWDIAHNCTAKLGLEDCVIYLMDAERKVLVQKAAYGPKNPGSFEIAHPIEIPVGRGITGHVALSGKAQIIPDTSKDPRYVVDDQARLSEIAVPILHEDRVIGVIDSEARRKNQFTREQLEALTTIASICASKIVSALTLADMKQAEKRLEEVNTKMMEAKYMNLRLQMNPHFLFNSLSSIQHLIVSRQTHEAYKYLSVFSHFLRSILQFADKTVIKLEDELRMLDMYIELERLGSDKEFHYDIHLDESLDIEDILVPPLMIQPIVENAIWHGLMHREGERRLRVTFRDTGDDFLECQVEDNGIGRQQASQIGKDNLDSLAYQSKSMALIEERLRLLQDKTGKPARLDIVDKMENGVPAGTLVKIIIPYYSPDDV